VRGHGEGARTAAQIAQSAPTGNRRIGNESAGNDSMPSTAVGGRLTQQKIPFVQKLNDRIFARMPGSARRR
jgi:hypothetical protein